MNDNQKKAALACVLSFLVGLLIATSGCSLHTHAHTHMGTDTGIGTGIGIGTHIGTTSLEVEACVDCGYAPWSDSWCEYHYGT
jgi:hypothetical protein